jgi:hypothetical protein
MQVVAGVVFVLLWVIYAGQLVSVVNLPLAQRLGFQEKPENVDALYRRDTSGTARWDLLSMWTLPVAGILMLINHSWWPYLALIGGGVYVDTGGRQAIKLLGYRSEGVRVGTQHNVRRALGVYALFVIVGGIAMALALVEVRPA